MSIEPQATSSPRAVVDPRREPALWIALGVTVVQLIVAFIPGLGSVTSGLIDAVVAAAGGFAVAVLVRHDGQVAAVVGLVQAVLTLLVGLGLTITSTQQALLLAVVNAAGALFVRTQVEVTLDASGHPRG